MLVIALGACLCGCASLSYYTESVAGHLEILKAARPVDEWIADPKTPAALRVRLEDVKGIRNYASRALDLPDNRSYRSYVELNRPYVVWNVFAAPALSLELKQWCFLVAGCVTYRGYFDKTEAQSYARTLESQGLDVQVAGVPAYSTLGWTADPILSTFIDYPEGEVARLIFHELAHELIYLPGDSTFNESFASTVEDVGVKRWLNDQGDPQMRASYERFAARNRAFLELLLTARQHLEANYASSASDATKLQVKHDIFQNLQGRYSAAKLDLASPLYQYTGYDAYFAQDLNNAHLAALATYTQRIPAFVKLLQRENGDLPRFYAAVRKLAHQAAGEREAELDELQKDADPQP